MLSSCRAAEHQVHLACGFAVGWVAGLLVVLMLLCHVYVAGERFDLPSPKALHSPKVGTAHTQLACRGPGGTACLLCMLGAVYVLHKSANITNALAAPAGLARRVAWDPRPNCCDCNGS
jgi:hypothetical protein